MINSILIESENKLRLVEKYFNKVKSGLEILVIKNAINYFTLNEWERYIKIRLGLTNDQRHYDIDKNLVIRKWWQIVYNPSKDTSYTYSKTKQPLHNDNAWFSDPAEINFFYMEKQANEGGENIFYPISRLCEDLINEEPQLYYDLKNVIVTIKKGNEYSNKTTIINKDNTKIFWNFYRTIKNNKEIKRMCNHFFEFLKKKELSKSVVKYRSETGDIFCFNDLSMLHGRLEFKANYKGDRSLFQSMWKI